MARTARTHKETVRPDFTEAERPDPSEDRTASDVREGSVEASHRAGPSEGQHEEIEVEAEILYNDDLGNEVPRDEGVQESSFPPNLSTLNYGQMPAFSSNMGQASVAEVVRKYPWRRDYSIYLPQPHQSAALPPKSRVAIYVDQLEVELRVPTTKFLLDCLRYWGVRITQLTPNAIRVLVGFSYSADIKR